MISMRYHIISLAAAFLALALGIVLGATKINSPLLAGLQGDTETLTQQRDQLQADNTALAADVASAEKMAESLGDVAVRGVFRPDPNVVLITTADANSADRDAVLSLLDKAGAPVATQIQLTTDFTDPARSQELRTVLTSTLPAGQTLPEVDDPGTLAGAFLEPAGGRGRDRHQQGERGPGGHRLHRAGHRRLRPRHRHPGGRPAGDRAHRWRHHRRVARVTAPR